MGFDCGFGCGWALLPLDEPGQLSRIRLNNSTHLGCLQVMEEIGIDLSAQLGSHAAPRSRVPGRTAAPAAAAPDEDAELRSMLASLK